MVESPVKNNCSDCIYLFLFLLFSVIERLQLKIEVLKAIIWGLYVKIQVPEVIIRVPEAIINVPERDDSVPKVLFLLELMSKDPKVISTYCKQTGQC